MNGTIALVTGGRINLGYHTALRLLRCGASVIVSTRYPRDAESRYQREPDSEKWAPRLKIVGADFRAAKDAFRLVVLVRNLLHDWDGNGKSRKLNILVNNAAQTLTDPVGSEARAVDRENVLRGQPGNGRLLIEDDRGYDPRVRGGMQISWTSELEGYNRLAIRDTDPLEANNELKEQPPQKGLRGETEEASSGKQSSWSQSLKDIPYEDMISAHSVNAFVPLILCRELLAFMGTAGELPPSNTASSSPPPFAKDSQNRTLPLSKGPRGYIVNVSSREGLFEQSPGNPHKRGTHVHTNMSKAAINMITETEASTAWSKYRVAMNTVDPGYMSAAPESYSADGCPIGFDDGAARVLWPIAAGVTDGIVIKGRFLKHFGATEVDVGLGRGNS
jgi:NAD(P)-dependent dehydrogenase (short-subunit alcohol dehydrogenase family)